MSHHNVAKLARAAGDETLQLICNTIASDEARHERAYTNFMGYLFEQDPAGAVLAFRDVLQNQIMMPAQNMGGAGEPDLFERFSAVAQRLGVYTTEHYAQIVTHLVERWRVESLAGLTGEAAGAGVRVHLGRVTDGWLSGPPAGLRLRLRRHSAGSSAARPSNFLNSVSVYFRNAQRCCSLRTYIVFSSNAGVTWILSPNWAWCTMFNVSPALTTVSCPGSLMR